MITVPAYSGYFTKNDGDWSGKPGCDDLLPPAPMPVPCRCKVPVPSFPKPASTGQGWDWLVPPQWRFCFQPREDGHWGPLWPVQALQLLRFPRHLPVGEEVRVVGLHLRSPAIF